MTTRAPAVLKKGSDMKQIFLFRYCKIHCPRIRWNVINILFVSLFTSLTLIQSDKLNRKWGNNLKKNCKGLLIRSRLVSKISFRRVFPFWPKGQFYNALITKKNGSSIFLCLCAYLFCCDVKYINWGEGYWADEPAQVEKNTGENIIMNIIFWDFLLLLMVWSTW